MGLAATQTRFLQLTARKSNVEYKGQQINQQRTLLSNKSANAYQSMLTLQVPTPPSSSDFIKIQYQYVDANGATWQTTSYDSNTSNMTVRNIATGEVKANVNLGQFDKDPVTGRYTKAGNTTLAPVEVVDNAAYDDAYNQYTYKQYLYEQELQVINAQTAIIQQQDKELELQLNQLDTEQNEIKTELEALDKVLGDNVEGSFKTFAG